jgi:hypothetical protein
MIYNVCIFGDSVANGLVFDETKKSLSCLGVFHQMICQNKQIALANYAKFGVRFKKEKLW